MVRSKIEKRRALFERWKGIVARRNIPARNPRHKDAYPKYRRLQSDYLKVKQGQKPALDLELEAWDTASDQDFEKFENSLE